MAMRRPSAPPPTFSCNELRQSAHAIAVLQGSRRNVSSTGGGAWSRPGGARRKKKRTDVIEDSGIRRKRGRIGTLGRKHQNAPQDPAPRATTSLDPDDPMHTAVAAAPPSCPAGASAAMKVPRVTRTPSVTTTGTPTRTNSMDVSRDTRTHNTARSNESALPQPPGRTPTAAHAPHRPTSHTHIASQSAAHAQCEDSSPPPHPRAAAGRVSRTEEYVEPLVEVTPTYGKRDGGEPHTARVRVRRVDDTEQADVRQVSQVQQVTRPMTDTTRASAPDIQDEPRQRTQAPPPPSGPPPARARPYVTRPKRNADGELTEAVRVPPPSNTTTTASHVPDTSANHTPTDTTTSHNSYDSSATAITIMSSQRSTHTSSHQRHPDVDLRSPHTHQRDEDEGLLEMRALEPCCLPMLEFLQAALRSLLEALSIAPAADPIEPTPRPKLGGVCCGQIKSSESLRIVANEGEK